MNPVHLRAATPGELHDADAVVRLEGSGPGRYPVRLDPFMNHGRGREEEVELDGCSDFDLELDLR